MSNEESLPVDSDMCHPVVFVDKAELTMKSDKKICLLRGLSPLQSFEIGY